MSFDVSKFINKKTKDMVIKEWDNTKITLRALSSYESVEVFGKYDWDNNAQRIKAFYEIVSLGIVQPAISLDELKQLSTSVDTISQIAGEIIQLSTSTQK